MSETAEYLVTKTVIEAELDGELNVINSSAQENADITLSVTGGLKADVVYENTVIEACFGHVYQIEASLDQRNSIAEANLQAKTIIDAEVIGGSRPASAVNVGGGAGVYLSALLGILQLRSLKSSDGSLIITEDGNEIDIVSAITYGIQLIELREMVKTGQPSHFWDIQYNAQGLLTTYEKWTDETMETKLFTKQVTYTGILPTRSVTTDETTGKVLTVDYLTYNEKGQPLTGIEVLT